jgi:hypothetical protein
MTLPKEWQQEAERINEPSDITSIQHINEATSIGYLQGATAYKQAVEKAINKTIVGLREIKEFKSLNIPDRIDELKQILTELQTLKPTSND